MNRYASDEMMATINVSNIYEIAISEGMGSYEQIICLCFQLIDLDVNIRVTV